MVRFWNGDLMKNIEGVVESIRAALGDGALEDGEKV
ncbi:MAG: hypothetical protein VCE91_05245 [Nitrospinota bacterium]